MCTWVSEPHNGLLSVGLVHTQQRLAVVVQEELAIRDEGGRQCFVDLELL